jgi:hypothetical protein
MKLAILSLLAITSAATTAVFAQEGSGQGPPHSPVVIGPNSSLPTTTSPTTTTGTKGKLTAARTK